MESRDSFLLGVVLAFILFPLAITAQQPSDPGSVSVNEWVRLVGSGREFIVDMPRDYIVHSDKEERKIYANHKGVSFTVDVIPSDKAKELLANEIRTQMDSGPYTEYRSFSIKDFVGYSIRRSDEEAGRTTLSIVVASKKARYRIHFSAAETASEVAQRFVRSLLLNGKPLFEGGTESDMPVEEIKISSLKSSQIVLEALNRPDGNQSTIVDATVRSDEKNDDEKKEKKVYSRSLIILKMYPPNLSGYARSIGESGKIKLRVTFLASGYIGKIELLESMHKGADKTVFNAVKKIKFLPAEIDGQPVDVTRPMEYSFSIH